MSLVQARAVLNSTLRSQPWATCGGIGFTGPTTCVDDYICVVVHEWFSQCFSAARSQFQKTCISAGRANADIAGIGVLGALGIQSLLSIGLIIASAPIDRSSRMSRAKGIVLRLLLVTIDVQTITGISLLGSALANWKHLDLYHFHIAYDIISITGASIWVSFYRLALSAHQMHLTPPFAHRFLAISVFCLLYLALTIAFKIRLDAWNPDMPGHCFEGSVFIRPDGPTKAWYPFSVYLTSGMILIPLIFGMLLSRACLHNIHLQLSAHGWLYAFLAWSVGQSVIHIAFFAVLRRTTQHFLMPGESENEWGFGQILVMFSLMAMLFQSYPEIETSLERKDGETSAEAVDIALIEARSQV